MRLQLARVEEAAAEVKELSRLVVLAVLVRQRAILEAPASAWPRTRERELAAAQVVLARVTQEDLVRRAARGG